MNRSNPSIFWDRSFYGMTVTQFLAVFNDNFYKQTVALFCVAMAIREKSVDLQPLAMLFFTVPYLLFSGYCGYLSDLLSKRTIIVISKIAEIVIMLLGCTAFLISSLPLMFLTLFLLGMHSTLYAPAKYGLLPELFSERQLPKVNGLFQMSMFLAIVLGISVAGILAERFDHPWVAPAVCMVIAGAGFFSALMIRPVPAARPGLKFDRSDIFINKETRKVILKDRELLAALLATSAFWMTGGLVYPLAINELGMQQLKVSEEITSYMAAGTGLGIAVGCVIGMVFSHNQFNAKLIYVGGWGMFLGLVALALPGPFQGTLLGLWGAFAMLVWLGICAGMYNVPLQVLIQARAPEEYKGRVIAAMNLANWIGIYLSTMLCMGANPLIHYLHLPYNQLFTVGALVFLPVILFYRPKSEILKSTLISADSATSSPVNVNFGEAE